MERRFRGKWCRSRRNILWREGSGGSGVGAGGGAIFYGGSEGSSVSMGAGGTFCTERRFRVR